MKENYIDINRNSYDILADEYKAKYASNSGAEKFYEILVNLIVKNKDNEKDKLLEIGPGIGTLLNTFEKEGLRTTAVELSKNMATLASNNSPHSVIINNNILDVDFMPKQFDFILAMAVIHNFPEEDLIKLLNKIKIWLKDTGYFIIDTTNNKSTEEGYFEKEDYNNKVVRYRKKWSKQDLELFMETQGFKIEESIIYVDKSSGKEWLIYSFIVK